MICSRVAGAGHRPCYNGGATGWLNQPGARRLTTSSGAFDTAARRAG